MVDINNALWSVTDASNNSNSPTGWNSTTTPAQVIPIQQAEMGAIKRLWERNGPAITAGGTGNAITYTPTNASYPVAYVQGDEYSFIAASANTGATTLAVNGLTAIALRKPSGSGPAALTGGEIQSGQVVDVKYDGSFFQLVSALPVTNSAGSVNVGSANQIAYYSSTGNAVSGIGFIPTGITATTPASLSNNTLIATAAYVDSAVAAIAPPPTNPVKAWCVFNGNTTGTNSPTAGLNVSTVTRNATGDYTINFTSTLTDANYAVAGSVNDPSSHGSCVIISPTTAPTNAALRINSSFETNTFDFSRISVIVTR